MTKTARPEQLESQEEWARKSLAKMLGIKPTPRNWHTIVAAAKNITDHHRSLVEFV